MNPLSKIIRATANLLFLYGMASFFLIPYLFKNGDEFVLADVRSFVADSRNIFIYTPFYSAVNVYDTSGKFVTSFQTEGFKGSENLFLTPKGELVLNFSNQKNLYYMRNGTFLREDTLPIQDTIARDDRYFDVPLLCYKLYRKQGNQKVLVLKQSYWKTLFTPPISMLLGMFFIIPMVLYDKLFAKREAQSEV